MIPLTVPKSAILVALQRTGVSMARYMSLNLFMTSVSHFVSDTILKLLADDIREFFRATTIPGVDFKKLVDNSHEILEFSDLPGALTRIFLFIYAEVLPLATPKSINKPVSLLEAKLVSTERIVRVARPWFDVFLFLSDLAIDTSTFMNSIVLDKE